MAPAPEPTAAAAGRKRKKPHGPSKIIAKKSADPKRAYAKKKKEKHKQKEKKSRLKPAEPDQIAATIGDGVAGATVLLSALMQPSRQLEFLLRSFERASKMRLSPLELDSYSGMHPVHPRVGFNSMKSSFACKLVEHYLKASSVCTHCRGLHGAACGGSSPGRRELR
jgi:hypothetical protein